MPTELQLMRKLSGERIPRNSKPIFKHKMENPRFLLRKSNSGEDEYASLIKQYPRADHDAQASPNSAAESLRTFTSLGKGAAKTDRSFKRRPRSFPPGISRQLSKSQQTNCSSSLSPPSVVPGSFTSIHKSSAALSSDSELPKSGSDERPCNSGAQIEPIPVPGAFTGAANEFLRERIFASAPYLNGSGKFDGLVTPSENLPKEADKNTWTPLPHTIYLRVSLAERIMLAGDNGDNTWSDPTPYSHRAQPTNLPHDILAVEINRPSKVVERSCIGSKTPLAWSMESRLFKFPPSLAYMHPRSHRLSSDRPGVDAGGTSTYTTGLPDLFDLLKWLSKIRPRVSGNDADADWVRVEESSY